VTYAVENTQTTSLFAPNDGLVDNRILCCLVISQADLVMRKFQSVLELLKTLRDAIKGH
jgi:hypothetical protein